MNSVNDFNSDQADRDERIWASIEAAYYRRLADQSEYQADYEFYSYCADCLDETLFYPGSIKCLT